MGNDASEGKVNEPETVYGKNRIRFFNSFEEMNDSDAREMANIDGITHLRNATALIKRLYGKELKQKMVYKIHFK